MSPQLPTAGTAGEEGSSQELRARRRVLEAFAERARVRGPRGVVMVELARELGMSTKTLYQHFPSKSELVNALMEDWARKLAEEQQARFQARQTVVDHLSEVAAQWIENGSRFAPVFWIEIARDFPEAHEIYQKELREALARARRWLEPLLRPEMDPRIALRMLLAAIEAVSDPAHCERLRISRSEAAKQAIQIWARGAIREPRRMHFVGKGGDA